MVEAKWDLYRLDFCADLTTVQAPVFTLGYMLEAAVVDGARFLGLASRIALTRVELDYVNTGTWPEMNDLDAYMGKLFERAWDFVADAPSDDLRLGSELLSRQFSAMSAFHFAKLDMPETLITGLQQECDDWQTQYYTALVSYGKMLKPSLTADVLLFEMPQSLPIVADLRPKVRSEAA